MTIKTKFLFSILAAVILVAIVGLVVYQGTQRIDREVNKANVAQQIVQVATTRRGLVFDYYRFHEERPKIQWQSLLDAQTKLTLSELFDTPVEQSVLRQIQETSEQIKSLFADLVTNHEKTSASPAEFARSRELEQVLVTNLLTKVQANINRAYTLSNDSLARISTAQKTLVIVTESSGVALLLCILMLFIFFTWSIAKPLAELKETFLRVSALDFTTTTTTTTTTNRKDELGALARAFNTMVVKLKESYATLEQKVTERTAKLAEKTQEAEDSQKSTLNVLEDLSVEKIKVENLAKDLEKFKLALDNTSEQVVITDPEGIVIYANRAVEKITGYMPEEAMGKKSGVLWKSPMPKEYYEKLWNTIKKEKKVFVDEIQNKRKNGEVYTAAISISPLFTKAGEIIYFVSIERDVTKEKEIDRAKSEFISLASHQLRTPLSTVNWYSEMLLSGDVGKVTVKQRKYLNEVYRGNQRMIDLVNALLNVSRLDLGTFVVEPVPTDVVKLVESVIDELRLQIEQKKLKFDERHGEGLSLLNVDPKLLRMVFQNILSNAIAYTPEKGIISLDLRLVKQGESVDTHKANEDSIAIVVRDTGYGIPKAQQDKIFTKLFRADNVRDKDTEGTGLGLYIVKSVIDHSGGMIWFESPYSALTSKGKEEIQGTTFYVTLPLDGVTKKEGAKQL